MKEAYPELPVAEAQLRILEDTLEFYGEDPRGRRAVDAGNSCEYYTIDSNPALRGLRCAIGRIVPEDVAKGLPSETGVDDCFTLLPAEVQRLHLGFLEALQKVHDCRPNWSDVEEMWVAVENTLNKAVDGAVPDGYSLFIGPFEEEL